MPMTETQTLETSIARVRAFNRFFTRRIGVLRTPWAEGFSLTEARMIYEIGQRDHVTASDLARDLDLDPGYLSRIISRFVSAGLVERTRHEADGRRRPLRLTKTGSAAFRSLDRYSHDAAAEMLAHLSDSDRTRLTRAMAEVERLLGDAPIPAVSGSPASCAPGSPAPDIILREPEPGELGWVVHRHGVLYQQECGWGASFEALVAGVVAEYIDRFDPARDRCIIAENDDGFAGSIFVAHDTAEPDIARLRLLLVERSARGKGVGTLLVEEAVAFAHSAGYSKLALWTQSELAAARRIYERTGFTRTAREPHTLFGPQIDGETWELEL